MLGLTPRDEEKTRSHRTEQTQRPNAQLRIGTPDQRECHACRDPQGKHTRCRDAAPVQAFQTQHLGFQRPAPQLWASRAWRGISGTGWRGISGTCWRGILNLLADPG